MLAAQSGIVAVGTGSHAYLELTLQSGVAPIHLAEALAALPEQRTTTGGFNLVAGPPDALVAYRARERPVRGDGFRSRRAAGRPGTTPTVEASH